MKKLLCAAAAIAGFATVAWGGYVSGVRVNGVDVGQTSSGDGWNFDDSHRINLKGSGKTYVITGADTGKRDIRVKIETDCTVVISNLTLAVEKSHCNALWLDASKSSLTGTVLFYGVNDLSSGGGAAGIGVKKGQTLNLLGMQATAELHATGGKSGAGIGGDDGVESESYSNCGTVGIFGGKVYATGGRGAAGIGGGGGNIWALGDDAPSVGHGGEVSIFQTSAPVCEVYATGGGAGEMSKQGGAGIGGGSSLRNCNNGNDGQGGSLTVYGGKVVARGGLNAAGIGGAAAANYGGTMSKVEISGGTVEAYGNGTAAGIGGAANSKTGILFHYVQSGGRVKAVGGNNGVPAIGGNDETGCGMMDISGGTVEAASVGDAGPKHFFLVMISGGSVVLTSPNAFGALYAGYADNVEDAVAVFPVRRTGYTSGAAVSINDFKGGTYGVKDIFAVGTSGEVCLWLPRGDYSFAINGATYMPSVDAEGGVTWRTPAKTAKVVVEDGGKTLRFVYDAADYGTKGTGWFSVAEAEAIDPQTDDVPWASYGGRVTKVIFDPSFAGYRPTQCGSWFYGFSSLATIEGIENLDTSEATNFAYMFDYCLTLTALDLSGFDTAKATDMHFMFADSKNLKTISVSDRFVTTKVADSSNMFRGCTALVGGAGTKYNSAKTDKTYARIDKTGAPGYFTKKEAKAVLADSGKTLRFVYDSKDYGTKDDNWFSVAEAEAIDPLFGNLDKVPWYGKRSTVTKVVFDSSFAAYRPKQCCSWFRNFGVLAAVDGLANLNTSVATNMTFMFCCCSALESLDVSGFNTANVTDMYNMFGGCSSLTSLDVSGFDTVNVTDMDYMFYGCSSLETICASDRFVTDRAWDSIHMFQDCLKLKGGAGTKYNSAKTDKTYARIDGKDGLPGYFTGKDAPIGGASAADDLNGDGRADIVMTIDETSHPADGSTGAWLIQSSQTAVWGDLSQRNAGWDILGLGATASGKATADVYLVSPDNVVGAWTTDNAGKVTGWKTIDSFNAATTVGGLGDFNGDGQSDLLLVNDNGAVGCYFTSGAKTGWNYFQSLGSEWQICGIGDLNGDGRDDLVLLHDEGFAGSWLTQADGTMEWANLDTLQPGFAIVGCGDFDGDGTDDVLLENGNYYGAWIVKNGNASGWMGLGDLGSVTVEQIADFDGDGRDDLRIRTANGDLGAELVKGEDSLTWAYYGSVGPEWLTEPLGLK